MATRRPVPAPEGTHDPVIRLHSVYRTPAERILVVLGSIEAEIRYDYAGVGERVFVNGELAARSFGFAFPCAPRFNFRLNGAGRWLPARVEVSVYWRLWIGIKNIRLVVANRVVYDEVKGHITIPADPTRLMVGSGPGPTLLSLAVGR
jgi:hypothetical protein